MYQGRGNGKALKKTFKKLKKGLDKPPTLWYNKNTKRVATYRQRKEVDTMTNKKITKRDRFNALLHMAEVKANPDMVAFIEHELELLAKKNSADKKPTAQQTANEAIKSAIVEAMEANRLYTVTEIQKSVDECADLSNQRVSALLRQLKDDGVIVRTEDKRKAYFSLA